MQRMIFHLFKSEFIRFDVQMSTFVSGVSLKYDYSEGSVTFVEDIIKKSGKDKENLSWANALTSNALGAIISHLWGAQIKWVKRGSRSHVTFSIILFHSYLYIYT